MLYTRPSCAHRLAFSAGRTRPCTPPITPCLPARYSTPAADAASHSHDVGILGGGITGLASAYYLNRQHPNAKITLYEAKDRVGGWLEAKRVPVEGGNVLFEAGPRTLRPQGNGVLAAKLLQDLDLAKDAIFTQKTSPAARSRFIYYPDRLVRMPHPSFGLLANIRSLRTEPVFETVLSSALKEYFRWPRYIVVQGESIQDESVGAFFSRRLSRTVVDNLLSALIHGIYAGDVYKLSAKSLFPSAWRAEGVWGRMSEGMLRDFTDGPEITKREAEFWQDMGNTSWDPLLRGTLKDNAVFTFADGLGMLAERLHAKLFETGRVEFKTNTAVDSIRAAGGNTGIELTTAGSTERRKHSHIISALSPDHLNRVAGTNLIGHVPAVNVMTVNLYFRTPGLHEPGFGYLIPRATPFEQNPERALGVIFDTAYSPGPSEIDSRVNHFSWCSMPQTPNMQDRVQTRGTKVTVMLGGHWWDDWPSFPDEQEGLALARSVLERHLGIKEEPEVWQVNFQKDCIPQYTVGHEQRLKDAHHGIWRQYHGRLRVAGNWMSGVGVNDCLRSAYDVAKNFPRDGTGLDHIGEKPSFRGHVPWPPR